MRQTASEYSNPHFNAPYSTTGDRWWCIAQIYVCPHLRQLQCTDVHLPILLSNRAGVYIERQKSYLHSCWSVGLCSLGPMTSSCRPSDWMSCGTWQCGLSSMRCGGLIVRSLAALQYEWSHSCFQCYLATACGGLTTIRYTSTRCSMRDLTARSLVVLQCEYSHCRFED